MNINFTGFFLVWCYKVKNIYRFIQIIFEKAWKHKKEYIQKWNIVYYAKIIMKKIKEYWKD